MRHKSRRSLSCAAVVKTASNHPGPVVAGLGGVLLLLTGSNLFLRRRQGREVFDRKCSEQALRQSEEKYRSIFESAPIAIFQSTLEGVFLSINPSLAAMFGYDSPREMQASVTDIGQQIFVQPEQRKELVESVLASTRFLHREVEYRRRDGTVFSANLYMRAVRDEEGTIQFLEGFVEDITDRKRAFELSRTLNAELEQRVLERTAELERANRALQQEVEQRRKAQYEISCLNDGLIRQRAALEAANKELESFSYSVSHDLRAPLRHITAYTDLLKEDFAAELGEQAQIYMQRIDASSAKMQELIEGLLSLSRVSRGEVNTVSIDLSIYAREIAQELQRGEPERCVTFVIAERAPAKADPVLVRSVLDNLMNNAWKYSSKKNGPVIEFGYEEREGEKVYYVRDNGAGFDMTYADKLFGVFQRMHTHAEFEGTGIGLATVQRIIHRHGGRIWAEAEVDKGATFYFTLS